MSLETINLTADGGVTKKILREGENGVLPIAERKVNVHYVGKFPEGSPRGGEIFDSSRRKGREFSFVLGTGFLNPCFGYFS